MRIASVALIIVLVTAGCGSDSTTSPSTTTATVTPSTEYFPGKLEVQGSSFFSFTVTQAGTVSVTLASLTTGSTTPASTTIGLGLGVPNADATACSISTSLNAAPALTAQLTGQAAVGTACVQVFDAGTLSVKVDFVVRIVHT